jgi:chlorite dismutase
MGCRSRSASGSWPTTSRSAAATPINTAYSFGLDDQEFVVSFEGDDPGEFLDLVQELRGTESSSYTLRDTPIFTCVAMSLGRALDALDGTATTAVAPPAGVLE